MKSKICSSKYVKTVSKGKGWIPAFLTLGFLLAFPVVILLLLGNWRGSNYTPEQMALLYENLWKDGFLITGGVVAVLAAILNGINGFIYLYSRRQTDFYHSLPVKRTRMFWNRVFTGLVYYLIPYVVMSFLAICIGAARGFFSLKLMASAIILCVLHLIIYFMVYFSVVLIFGITGNLLMGIFCFAMLYCYGPGISLLIGSYRYVFYHTYYTGQSYGILRFLREFSSPAGIVRQFIQGYSQGQGMRFLMLLLVLAVVFAALAYIAYLKRPSEAAGQPMVYASVALVVKFLVVVPWGLAVGYIFYLIPTSNIKILWWAFGLVLGTVLAHGFIETSYQMDFHCFFKKKIQLLVCAVLVAACAMAYETDLFQYDNRMPSHKKIESVSMDLNVLSSNISTHVQKLGDGSYRIMADSSNWDQWAYNNPDKKKISKKTYEVLKQIAEKQVQRGGRFQSGDNYYTSEDSDICFKTGVMYKLRTGKKIYRSYRINASECRELLKCLYEEENLKDFVSEMLELDTGYLDEVYLNTIDGKGYSIFQEQKEKGQKLIEALKKDVKSITTDDFLDVPCGSLHLSYLLPVQPNVNSLVPGRMDHTEYVYNTINVLPGYKNTIAVLEETDYPVTLEEIPVEKASVTYYVKDKEKTVIYDKPEEVQELKDAAVPVMGMYSWLECAENLNVIMQTGQGYEFPIQLLEDKLPDFVKNERKQITTSEEIKGTEDESVALIGGAEGPTSIYIKEKKEEGTDE